MTEGLIHMTALPVTSPVEKELFENARVTGPRAFVSLASSMFCTPERRAANTRFSDFLGLVIEEVGTLVPDEFGAVYVAFADRLGLDPEGPLCDQRGHDPEVYEREWAALMVAISPAIMALVAAEPERLLTTEDRLRELLAPGSAVAQEAADSQE